MDETQSFLRNAKLFSLRIDNFNGVINDEAVVMYLGTVGGYQWHAKIQKFSEEGVDYLSIEVEAFLPDLDLILDMEFSTELAICVKNESPERWEKCQERFEVEEEEWIGWEKFMRMDTILEPDSGFLTDDGALMIQFEIRVNSIIDLDGIGMFNFFDPFEGSVRIQIRSLNLYMCKKLLILHSPVLAEQLTDGTDEIIISEYVAPTSALTFFQMIHGVKTEVGTTFLLDIFYLAHKYQVLTVLRHFEIEVKTYSDEDIHDVHIPLVVGWIKMFLHQKHRKHLRRMHKAWGTPFSGKYKKLNIRKRKMLLAITRAPFSIDALSPYQYDDTETETELSHCSSPISIFRFFSKIVKRITGH